MKLHHRLLLVVIATAVAVPCTTFAAKADKKKKTDTSAVTFASIDRNKDGAISRGEYLSAMKDKLAEQDANARFNALDTDRNGRLSEAEFNAGSGAGEKKKNNDKKKGAKKKKNAN